jgi:hypothetical protein
MCTTTWTSWLEMQGEHIVLMVLPVLVTILYYRRKDRAPRATRAGRALSRFGPTRRPDLSDLPNRVGRR